MKVLIDKAETYLEWIFKIGILIYALLSFNSFFYGKTIISVVLWPIVCVGCLLLLYRLKDWREYICNKSIILLLFFIGSYLISAVCNIEYGYKPGIIKLFFLLFYFFILFARKKNVEYSSVEKEIKVLGGILTGYMFIAVIISFALMICNYTRVETIENGWDIGIGFLWGRLWGIFTEPNYASVCATIVIILSFYFIQKSQSKRVKVFFIVNDVLQVLYIAFTDSRTGCVALGFGLAVYVFNYLNYKRLQRNSRIKLYMVIVIPIAAMVIGMVLPKQITTAYNEYRKLFSNSTNEVNRGYDLSNDVTNRRFDIWVSGLEVVSTTPIVGTSYTNILNYTLDNCEGTYLINNSAEKNFSSIHNEVLNILVGQGIIGLVIFLLFVIYAVSHYVKYYFKLPSHESDYYNMIVSCMAVAVMAAMVLTGMFYSNSPTAILFWILLGAFMLRFDLNGSDLKISSKQ